MSEKSALVFAALSSLSFSLASFLYRKYGLKLGPKWLSAMKATAGFLCFLLLALWRRDSLLMPDSQGLAFLFASGAIGLALGDIFMVVAMMELGVSRTLMLFSFQPAIVAWGGKVFFGQFVSWNQLLAMAAMIACVLTISFEKYRKEGHWGALGLVCGVFAVLMDNVGSFLTRGAFDANPELTSFTANLLRCFAAVMTFVILSPWLKINFLKGFQSLKRSEQFQAFFMGALGVCVSLSLWLEAIKIGHLSSVFAVGTGGAPIFTLAIECIGKRKWPDRVTFLAFAFFLAGMFLLFQ